MLQLYGLYSGYLSAIKSIESLFQVGYLLAFTPELGVQGVWYGLLFGLTTSAALLTLRFNAKSKYQVKI